MKVLKNKKILLVILVFVALLISIVLMLLPKKTSDKEEIDETAIETIDESKLGRVKEGITLKNLDFENLTREKAKLKLEERQDEILEDKINFKFGEINDIRTNPRTLTYKLSDVGYEIDYAKTIENLFQASEGEEVKPVYKLNDSKFADFSDSLFADVSLEPINDRLVPVYDNENNKKGYSDPEKVFVKSEYEKGIDGRKLDVEQLKNILNKGFLGELNVPIEVIKRKEIDPNMSNKSLELLNSITYRVKPLTLNLNTNLMNKTINSYNQNNSILMNYLNNAFISPYGKFDLDRYLLTEKDLEKENYKNRLQRFTNGVDEEFNDFLDIRGAGISQGMAVLYELLLTSNFDPINVSHYSYYDPIFKLGMDVKYNEKKPFILENNSASPILIKAKTIKTENNEINFNIQIYGITTDYRQANISSKVIKKVEPKTVYIKSEEVDKNDITYTGREGLKIQIFKNNGGETKQIDEVNYLPLDNLVIQ